MNPVESLITVGRVVQSRGVRGEVVVYPLSDDPSRFRAFDHVIGVDKFGETTRLDVEKVDVRYRHGRQEVLIHFDGVDSREASDALKGLDLYVEREALPLDADEYFLFDLVGIEVQTDSGEPVGTVSEVRRMPAQDLFVIRRPSGGELLIPDVPEFVDKSLLSDGKLVVHPIDGLLEAQP
jgi:16S rRNA processing protein RimM